MFNQWVGVKVRQATSLGLFWVLINYGNTHHNTLYDPWGRFVVAYLSTLVIVFMPSGIPSPNKKEKEDAS